MQARGKRKKKKKKKKKRGGGGESRNPDISEGSIRQREFENLCTMAVAGGNSLDDLNLTSFTDTTHVTLVTAVCIYMLDILILKLDKRKKIGTFCF